MGKLILRGQVLRVRGSNKKYPELNDLDSLLARLQVKCPAHVAKDMSVPPSCILYLIDKYYTEVEKASICWKRKRHPALRKNKINE